MPGLALHRAVEVVVVDCKIVAAAEALPDILAEEHTAAESIVEVVAAGSVADFPAVCCVGC